MALDFLLLRETGEKVESATIPLGVRLHAILFLTIDDAVAPISSRFRDYYRDAHVFAAEAEDFRSELLALKSNNALPDDAVEFIERVSAMARQAHSAGYVLAALAD